MRSLATFPVLRNQGFVRLGNAMRTTPRPCATWKTAHIIVAAIVVPFVALAVFAVPRAKEPEPNATGVRDRLWLSAQRAMEPTRRSTPTGRQEAKRPRQLRQVGSRRSTYLPALTWATSG